MTIAIGAIAVVTRVDAIQQRWPGGLDGYSRAAPNRTFRSDGQLAAVDFMAPADVRRWVEEVLAPRGFLYVVDGEARDVAVVDALQGCLAPCSWVEHRPARAWGEATLAGTAPGAPVGPPGWSPSDPALQFMPGDEAFTSFRFIEERRGVLQFEDEATGQAQYVALDRRNLAGFLSRRLAALQARLDPLTATGNIEGPEGLTPGQRALLRQVADEAGRMAAIRGIEAQASFVAGLALRLAGDYAAAFRHWSEFVQREPAFLGGHMEVTACLSELGRHEDAFAAAQQAIAIDPDDPGAVANMGLVLLRLGRIDEAAAWIGRARAMSPDDLVTRELERQLGE